MAGGSLILPQAPRIFGPRGEVLDVDGLVQEQLRNKPKRNRAYCKVYMNGQDLTSRLDPVLLSVRVTDRKFGASVANLTIDDRYGQIPDPPDGARVGIALGWPDEGAPKQFSGTLANVISSGQRQQGRTLDLEFTSYDMGGDGKTPVKMTWGEGNDGPNGKGKEIPFSDIVRDLGNKAGIKITVAPSIGEKKRTHWAVDGENPLGAIERFARELGGSFKVEGGQGGITDPGTGQSADGTAFQQKDAVVGQNVLAWRIIPTVRRAQWGSLWQGFFNRDKAVPEVVQDAMKGGFGFGQVEAKRMGPWPTNDAEMAKTSAAADNVTAVAKRGTGWIVVDGMPDMTSGAPLGIHGCRQGVDGTYTAEEVEHHYFRGGGFTTRIDVERPDIYDNSPVKQQWQNAPR